MSNFSERFQKRIIFTFHALERMKKRNIEIDLVLELIETGEIQYKEIKHAWIFKHYQERSDNLICAVVIIGEMIVIKTVMINWQWIGEKNENYL